MKRPVRLLLGKRADMAERGEAAREADRAVPADPGFAEAGAPLPAPGAFLVDVAGEDRVGALPLVRGEPRRPDRLLLRPVERQRAEALELAPVAGIEQRVVVEPLRLQDERGGAHAAVRRSCTRSSRFEQRGVAGREEVRVLELAHARRRRSCRSESGLPSSVTTAPPAARSTASPAAVSHSIVGPRRG